MTEQPLGFIGLGAMGEAMAIRLIGAGRSLVVWNRTPARCVPLAAAGATVAESLDAVFASCDSIILMLANVHAIHEVLGMDADGNSSGLLADRVRGKTLIQMGTILPEASLRLAQTISAAGGTYVEAPVSGSHKPAETGQLVAMVAGPPRVFATVHEILSPLCRQIVECGEVPRALAMKLSVNVLLVAQVVAFAEAVNLARASGVDLNGMAQVLLSGPMANDLMRVKLPKLLNDEMQAQASIHDVHYNLRVDPASGR